MKILGLDPGLGTTGWGLIEAEGNRLSHVANGQIKTDSAAPLPRRLATLGEQLEALIAEQRPDSAAEENTCGASWPKHCCRDCLSRFPHKRRHKR